MKQINNFILEKLKINKDSQNVDQNKINSIFKNIDINDFEWISSYGIDTYQDKCKNEVKEFAYELYEDLKPYKRIEQLFRDSYKQYLTTYKSWSKEKIDEQYSYQIKILDKYGWSQLANNSLEQGWWAFMYWIKLKYNK